MSEPAPARRVVAGNGTTRTPQGRLLRAMVLIVIGMLVTVGSASSDAYLHRGATVDSNIIYQQPAGAALATNVDLRNLTANALQSEIGILREAGYQFLRQPVYWSDVEKTPGKFDWSIYSPIFDSIAASHLTPVLVLQGTPYWARYPTQVDALDAPPFSMTLLDRFCQQLMTVAPTARFFQIGANLDDPDYWGHHHVSAFTYANMLQAASHGLNIAGIDGILISGEIGANPTLRETGEDLATIRRLFVNPDIRGQVRVLAVSIDGGNTSPYDRNASARTDNLSRAVLVREAIDDTGALTLPVWFTHLGWGGDGGSVSANRQGQFVAAGIRRVRDEWPWVGLVFNWAYGNGEPMAAEANLPLVVNGQQTPLMDAMIRFGKSIIGSSMSNGFSPPDSSACTYNGNWQAQHLREGQYRLARDPGSTVTCRFWGTGFSTVFRFSPDAGTARYVVDRSTLPAVGTGTDVGNVFLTYRVENAFEQPVELVSGLPEGYHTITIGLADNHEVVIGGYLVERERPMIWPIAVLVAAGIVAMFLGLRTIAYLAAEMVGMIDTRPHDPTQTALPTLTEWNPMPRFRR